MVGDNIYIHIQFKDFKEVEFIRKELMSIFKKSTGSNSELAKAKVDSDFSYDEILFYFQNDYDVPANFFVSYYNLKEEKAKEISISGYNHPAGEFLLDQGVFLCEELNKIDAVKMIIMTNDSAYSTEEIFKKINDQLTDIGGVYMNINLSKLS